MNLTGSKSFSPPGLKPNSSIVHEYQLPGLAKRVMFYFIPNVQWINSERGWEISYNVTPPESVRIISLRAITVSHASIDWRLTSLPQYKCAEQFYCAYTIWCFGSDKPLQPRASSCVTPSLNRRNYCLFAEPPCLLVSQNESVLSSWWKKSIIPTMCYYDVSVHQHA